MFLIWLCKARKDTGESMASRLLAQRRTTFSPVWWIFSVSWSTAMLLGAQTSTGLQRGIGCWHRPEKLSKGPWKSCTAVISRYSHAKIEQEKLPVTCLATISSMAASPSHLCEAGLWVVEHKRCLYCNAVYIFYVDLAEL